MSLLLWPTQTRFELPGWIARAAIGLEPVVTPLMIAHVGRVVLVFAVRASSGRHRDGPPASSRFGVFGSSRIGEMKLVVWFVQSAMTNCAAVLRPQPGMSVDR